VSGSRHTPGPWRWDEDGNLVAADGKRVLTAATFLLDHRELAASIDAKEPDAALVAAAPDLLEALREIEQASTWTMHSGCMEPIGRLTDIARTAIARAEGRET